MFLFRAPPGLNTSQHNHTPRSRAWNSSQHPHPTDKHLLVEELQDPPGSFAHFFMIRFFSKVILIKIKKKNYKNLKTNTQIHLDPTHPKTNKKNQGYWFYHTNISAGSQSLTPLIEQRGKRHLRSNQAKEQPVLHTASKKQKIPLLRVVYNSCWRQFVSKLLLHRDTIQYARRYDKFE